VIAIDQIGFESPIRRISNRQVADPRETTLRMTFKAAGSFEFKCRIQTWMKGKIEVLGV
jgi:plastocyanin